MGLFDSILGGSNAGKSEQKESMGLIRDNVEMLKKIGVPEVEALRISLESPELVGQLVAEQLGTSAYEGIQVDPRLREAQMGALQKMSGLAEQGLSDEDKAQFTAFQRQAAGQDQARQASILQEMAAQGMGDSGASLVAKLQSSQAATDRLSQQGNELASQAAAARRQAIGQSADMASSVRGQDTALASQQAQAKDMISQFNAQERMSAQQRNLAEKQRIADSGTATRNLQQTSNKDLIQQRFENELTKARAVAGQQDSLAGALQAQGAAKQAAKAGQLGTLLTIGGAAAGFAAGGGPQGAMMGAQIGSQLGGQSNASQTASTYKDLYGKPTK